MLGGSFKVVSDFPSKLRIHTSKTLLTVAVIRARIDVANAFKVWCNVATKESQKQQHLTLVTTLQARAARFLLRRLFVAWGKTSAEVQQVLLKEEFMLRQEHLRSKVVAMVMDAADLRFLARSSFASWMQYVREESKSKKKQQQLTNLQAQAESKLEKMIAMLIESKCKLQLVKALAGWRHSITGSAVEHQLWLQHVVRKAIMAMITGKNKQRLVNTFVGWRQSIDSSRRQRHSLRWATTMLMRSKYQLQLESAFLVWKHIATVRIVLEQRVASLKTKQVALLSRSFTLPESRIVGRSYLAGALACWKQSVTDASKQRECASDAMKRRCAALRLLTSFGNHRIRITLTQALEKWHMTCLNKDSSLQGEKETAPRFHAYGKLQDFSQISSSSMISTVPPKTGVRTFVWVKRRMCWFLRAEDRLMQSLFLSRWRNVIGMSSSRGAALSLSAASQLSLQDNSTKAAQLITLCLLKSSSAALALCLAFWHHITRCTSHSSASFESWKSADHWQEIKELEDMLEFEESLKTIDEGVEEQTGSEDVMHLITHLILHLQREVTHLRNQACQITGCLDSVSEQKESQTRPPTWEAPAKEKCLAPNEQKKVDVKSPGTGTSFYQCRASAPTSASEHCVSQYCGYYTLARPDDHPTLRAIDG